MICFGYPRDSLAFIPRGHGCTIMSIGEPLPRFFEEFQRALCALTIFGGFVVFNVT